jgi:uncharacterized protein involved in outer membrane biogenesis
MDANEISLTGKTVDIANLRLSEPFYSTFSYTGRKPKATDSTKKKNGSSPSEWNIILNNVKIDNGRFKTDNESKLAAEGVFDPEHIDFTKIN